MHRFKQHVAGESSEIRVPSKVLQTASKYQRPTHSREACRGAPKQEQRHQQGRAGTMQSPNTSVIGGCFLINKMHRFKQQVTGESSEIRVPGKWPQICPKKGAQISAQVIAIKPASSNNERQPRQQWSCQANCNSACSSEFLRLPKTTRQCLSNRTFQSGCFPIKKMHRFKQHVAGESSEIRVPGKWPQVCPNKVTQISAQLVAIKPASSNNERQPRQQWSCQANCNSACSSELLRLPKTTRQCLSNRTFQSGCFPIKKMHRFKQHVAGESSEIRVSGKWPQICPKKGTQISAQLVAIKPPRSNNERQPRLQWSCQANCNSA